MSETKQNYDGKPSYSALRSNRSLIEFNWVTVLVLADDFPTITFSPCSAHCLDLLLEDIGKLPWASDIIRKGHTKIISGQDNST